MNTVTIESKNTNIVDALMILFKNQSKAVRKEFLNRAFLEENEGVSPKLAKQIVTAESEFRKGNTVHFDSLEDFDKYMENV